MQSVSVILPIIIPSLKHLAMTQECVKLARQHTQIPFELVIIESGSTYFTDECDIHIHEKTISTPEKAHNLGFRIASRKDFVILLTNDTFVANNWLDVLLDTFVKKTDCGLATLGCERFGHVRGDVIEEGFWFDVCAVRSEVFHKIGYYDERFIGSWPDTDFLVRAYKEGWKMYRNLNCVLTSEINHATVHLNPQHSANYERGRKLFNEKHAGCGLPVFEAYR